MRVLVTGSSGFIGTKLCLFLEKQSIDVIPIDFETGYDITNPKCFQHIKKTDVIVHLASLSYVPQSFKEPYKFYKENTLGTLNILELAKEHHARVVFFSSYLYGIPKILPVSETNKLRPHNPYAESKKIGEELCEAYHRDFGVDSIIFRPFNIYGEGQNPSFLIPTIINQIHTGEVKLMDSSPKRDYIHINDIIYAVDKAIKSSLIGCDKFNLGSGISYSVSEIADIIRQYSPIDFTVSFNEIARKNEVSDCYADISKAKKVLNWSPQIDIHEGLQTIMANKKW